MDVLLEAWLSAAEGPLAEDRLTELIQQARPLIRRVATARLAGVGEDLEDLCAEVQMELLLWLWRLKTQPGYAPIRDYPAYVSAVAANACNRYFRRRPAAPMSVNGPAILSSRRLEAVPDGAQRAEQAIDCRRYASKLWKEIGELPSRQRKALLFHLRDEHGNSALSLFSLTGTAFLPAIAAAVGMTDLELSGLWNDLPLDDNRIAALLACTRQQVINLRMSARKRLAKRMEES